MNKSTEQINLWNKLRGGRCALVHEAMTKNNWYINARRNDQLSSPKFIENVKGKKCVMRSILHARMIDYLISYVGQLRDNSYAGKTLRRLFARKMDHLFEITPDNVNFEWWLVGQGD